MADLMERRPPSSGIISRDSRRDLQRRQSVHSACQAAPQMLQKLGIEATGAAPAASAAAGSSMGITWSGSTLSGSMGRLLGSGGGHAVGSFPAVKTPPRDFLGRAAWKNY